MIINSIKNNIYNRIRTLLLKLLPEVNILSRQNSNRYVLNNTLHRSLISKKAKLYPVYFILDSSIDDYTYVSRGSSITMTKIGKFCSIGPNFLCGWGIHPTNGLSTSPMFYSSRKQNGITLSKDNKIEERKQIIIGNDVFIGANVTVLDGVTIGDGAVIGAGAVVSKDIPPYAIAVGCPIRIIKYRFNDETINKLLSIKWWNWEESKLSLIEKNFFSVDTLIKEHIIEKD